jgi:toxin ParE1/3/4
MPTYRKTRRADEDLQEIYRYTRRTWGRDQAVRYIRGLEQRYTALADNPLAGIAREDL